MRSIYKKYIAALSVGICVATADDVQATPITVNNFDFSNPSLANGNSNGGSIPGWSATVTTGTIGTYNPGIEYYSNPSIVDPGSSGVIGTMADPNVAFLYWGSGQSISTATGYSIVAGETYRLTVAVGNRNGAFAAPFGGWQIELLDGDSVLAMQSGISAPAPGSFGDVSLYYTAVTGDSGLLRIRLSQPGVYADYDNVRLDVVPEPASVMLLGVGFAGFAMTGRYFRYANKKS